MDWDGVTVFRRTEVGSVASLLLRCRTQRKHDLDARILESAAASGKKGALKELILRSWGFRFRMPWVYTMS